MMGLRKEIPVEVQTFDLSKRILTGKGKQPGFQPYYRIEVAEHDKSGLRGLRTDRYTFVAEIKDRKIENCILLDRQEDPYQMENKAFAYPELVEKFQSQLKKWLIQTDDPIGKGF